MKTGFCNLTVKDLEEWLLGCEEKKFHARQIMSWVYEKGVDHWDEMTNLSKSLREKLEESFELSSLKLVRCTPSDDKETFKYLWRMTDGTLVESVLICSEDRRTVCVSSQVGCPAKCAFCASGKMGFFRNLSASEIVDQVVLINAELKKKGERVSNIVYMGMGEPLMNLNAVIRSIELLNSPSMLNISQRRITVSTVGIVEGIHALAEKGLKISLVLSLHAPSQHIRKKIIPYARKYPLDEVMLAMDRFFLKTKRDITYEYILIAGINDKPEHARDLAKLVGSRQCVVNLIPYNPVPGLKLKRPKKDAVEFFRKILTKEGVNHTCRYTKGDDIAAACGQLALQEDEQTNLLQVSA
ncbi:MAG: 23S rRNA (adenine2503-C2)-methyltransferase [Chlamydiales bacterium]|jgi:23S rRNA (adenine2503-C2)-methyltransferase